MLLLWPRCPRRFSFFPYLLQCRCFSIINTSFRTPTGKIRVGLNQMSVGDTQRYFFVLSIGLVGCHKGSFWRLCHEYVQLLIVLEVPLHIRAATVRTSHIFSTFHYHFKIILRCSKDNHFAAIFFDCHAIRFSGCGIRVTITIYWENITLETVQYPP
jgi:hypothetical protein